MAECWEYANADMNNWAPWVRFFGTSDDKHFVIDADLIDPPGWVTNVIRRNTALLYCTEDAGVTDLNCDAEFPPGTTCEQAIEQMGYTFVGTREYVQHPTPITNGAEWTPPELGSTADSGSTA